MGNENYKGHWKHCRISEIAELIRGISYLKEQGIRQLKPGYKPILRANNISGELNFDDFVYVPEHLIAPNQFIKKGDLIFAMSSGSKHLVGKSAKARFDFDGSYGAFCALLRVTNQSIIDDFLGYYFQGNKYRKLISEIATGTNINNLKREHILNLSIPLPPLPEQHRIVAKIEELFSELDNGIASLKQAKEQLKVYRQGVLKWAFEGKLTNEDLKEGELPEGWKWRKLKEITSILGDGLHGTPEYSENGDYYFINGNNLQEGYITIKPDTKKVDHTEFLKYKKPLNENTILVSINGTIGNVAFFRGERVVLGKSACYFNVKEDIDKRYIRYVIKSQRFFSYAMEYATGSTIKNVGLKAMREFEIAIPNDILEQSIIVKEIESKFSLADQVDQSIDESLQKAEALRQSILKSAFEGRLI